MSTVVIKKLDGSNEYILHKESERLGFILWDGHGPTLPNCPLLK